MQHHYPSVSTTITPQYYQPYPSIEYFRTIDLRGPKTYITGQKKPYDLELAKSVVYLTPPVELANSLRNYCIPHHTTLHHIVIPHQFNPTPHGKSAVQHHATLQPTPT